MGMPDDKAIDATIAELRRHRALLDELNAEYRRVRDERLARLDGYDALLKALRDNPSEETANAYVRWVDDINGKSVYEREGQVEGRCREVRDAMQALQGELLQQLGVALVEADWMHP
jgi:predicted aminopeptidase